jgi:transposase
MASTGSAMVVRQSSSVSSSQTCRHCGAGHQPVHDTPAREWRHLNVFQFQAYLQAKAPRVRCGACGKTTQVELPWARPGTGFTRLTRAIAS